MSVSALFRYGTNPVMTHQAGVAPGPIPQKGPPHATGGPFRLPCGARRHKSNITDQQILPTNETTLTIMHWNAEGVNSKKDGFSKKLELENTLLKEQVSICCIQETHLSKDVAFKITGYQCFRADRIDRRKGGILTLVKNNISAHQTELYMEGAEY